MHSFLTLTEWLLVSLILIKSVSTGAEICCRFCQAFPSDPYRLGCGTVSLTVSYQRTKTLNQQCCVPSGKPFQNIGVGRFRKLGRGAGKVLEFFTKSVPFLISKSDNIRNSRIELKGIVLPVPSNHIYRRFWE